MEMNRDNIEVSYEDGMYIISFIDLDKMRTLSYDLIDGFDDGDYDFKDKFTDEEYLLFEKLALELMDELMEDN